MAIKLGSNFSYKGDYFLDERIGQALTKSDLLNWSIPIPNGFEIFLKEDSNWYTYLISYNDKTTGHFKLRSQNTSIDLSNVNNRLDILDKSLKTVNHTLNSFYANTFNDLLIESNWIVEGTNLLKKGIVVSVIEDPDEQKNGVYYLVNNNFKLENSWKKLCSKDEIINPNPDIKNYNYWEISIFAGIIEETVQTLDDIIDYIPTNEDIYYYKPKNKFIMKYNNLWYNNFNNDRFYNNNGTARINTFFIENNKKPEQSMYYFNGFGLISLTKGSASSGVSGVEEAPIDGNSYIRKNGKWEKNDCNLQWKES